VTVKCPGTWPSSMDGNRRFAKEFGLSTTEGHIKGKEKLEEVMEWCLELGVKILTVYAFSTENLDREPPEVEYLMKLFEDNFRRLATDERIHKYHIRLTVIGQRELLPSGCRKAIEVAEEAPRCTLLLLQHRHRLRKQAGDHPGDQADSRGGEGRQDGGGGD